MMTTIQNAPMDRVDAECIMRLKTTKDWNHFLLLMARRKLEVIDLLTECDPAMDEFYKGAAFMLREVILLDGVAEEVVNILDDDEPEEEEEEG